MSPGAAPAACLVTSTAAGVRSGRDWKISTSPGTRGAAGSGIDGIDPAGVAIVKRNVPALAPRTCSLVLHRDHLAGRERLGREEASALPVGVRDEPAGVSAAARAGDESPVPEADDRHARGR